MDSGNIIIRLMGQNGARKSSIFKLLTGVLKPQEGEVHIQIGARVAIDLHVMACERMEENPRLLRRPASASFARLRLDPGAGYSFTR